MIRTEMTTDSSRVECRFKKVLAVREKMLLQTAAPAHIVPINSISDLHRRKKQANKEVKSHLFQKCENISHALFFFICSSMAVSLCCQVTQSSGIQLFSIFFANCIVSSDKYGN